MAYKKLQKSSFTTAPALGTFQAPRPFSEPKSADAAQNVPQQDIQRSLSDSNCLGRISIYPPISEAPVLQPKLTIGAANDPYEKEADQVAHQVVTKIHSPAFRTPQPQGNESIQRQIGPRIAVMRKPTTQGQAATATPDLETSIRAARSSGHPIRPSIKEPMEQAFGSDFSRVRIHTDAQSDQLNRSIQARAFTTGQDIFFRQGEYNPNSMAGQELIAHELTHVLQQTGQLQRSIPLNSAAKLINFSKPSAKEFIIQCRRNERNLAESESEQTTFFRNLYGIERGSNARNPHRLDAWGQQGLLTRPGGVRSRAIPRWEQVELQIDTFGRENAIRLVQEQLNLLRGRPHLDPALALSILTFEGGNAFSNNGRMIVSGRDDFHRRGESGFDNIYNQSSDAERQALDMRPIPPDLTLLHAQRRLRRDSEFADFRSADIPRANLLGVAMIAASQATQTFERHLRTVMVENFGTTEVQIYLSRMDTDARRAWTQLMFGGPGINARARPLIRYLYEQYDGTTDFLNRIMDANEATLSAQSRYLTVDIIRRSRSTAITARGIEQTVGSIINSTDQASLNQLMLNAIGGEDRFEEITHQLGQ